MVETSAHVESLALQYKVLVLGSSTVGKTSLIRRYTSGTFPVGMLSTVGIDFTSKILRVEGVPVELRIWDTAGQEKFATFTKQFLRGAHGILVMYDITSGQSFKDISRWMNMIEEADLGHEAIVLIGNKHDLDNEREVETSSAEHLADSHSCQFFECSARTGHNVEKIFYEVARGILIRNGIFVPGRLPSLDPVVFAKSGSPVSTRKSIILSQEDLEQQEHHKKSCCVHHSNSSRAY